MGESLRQTADIAGLAIKQSNALTHFRQRDTEFLERLPLDVAAAERLILCGLVTKHGETVVPAETLLDAAFEGENNHLDARTVAAAVDAVFFLQQLLREPQAKYNGRSILEVLAAVAR